MAKTETEITKTEKAIDHSHPQPQPKWTQGCNNDKVQPLMHSLSKGNQTSVESPPTKLKESEIEHGNGSKKTSVANEI